MVSRDLTASSPRLRDRNACRSQATLFAAMLTLSSLVGCAATSNDSSQASSASIDSYPEIIEADQARLTVFGLSCPLCATNVEKALTSVPGVLGASIDLSNGRIDLLLDPTKRTRSVDIAHAVKDAGFTLRAIELP